MKKRKKERRVPKRARRGAPDDATIKEHAAFYFTVRSYLEIHASRAVGGRSRRSQHISPADPSDKVSADNAAPRETLPNDALEQKKREKFAERLRTHAEFVRVWDEIEAEFPVELLAESMMLGLNVRGLAALSRRMEANESRHPGYSAEVVHQLRDLEAAFAASHNGMAAWEALSLARGAGWPVPPRWVMDYLADAAMQLMEGVEPQRALAIHRAGGPTAARRLATLKSRRDVVSRLVQIVRGLDLAIAPDVFADGVLRELESRVKTRACARRDEYRQQVGPFDSNVEIAAHVLSRELGGSPSPRTIVNWYQEEANEDTFLGRTLASRLAVYRTP